MRSRKFGQRGSNFDKVFVLVDEGREDQPASETPFKAFHWYADDGPTLNAGLVAL